LKFVSWSRDRNIFRNLIYIFLVKNHSQLADSEQSNQSKKAEVVNCYYQWQILKPSGKRKIKRNFTVSVKTPKGAEEKTTLKGTTGMTGLRDPAR
jgi:hypothetical protein